MAQTPLLITTTTSLINDQCLDVNLELQGYIVAYKALSDDLSTLARSRVSNPGFEDAYNRAPFIVDFYDYSLNIYTKFSDYFNDWNILVLGHDYGGNRKFISTLQVSMSYMSSINDKIVSGINSLDVGKSSFTSVNDLTTGNLTAVTTDTKTFADDLENTGRLINLEDLKNLGTPHALVRALVDSNAIQFLEKEFSAVGIDVVDLSDAVLNNNTPLLLKIQKMVYDIALAVTGKQLNDIMLMLNVKTKSITTLADLLDTKKIFPNCFKTIQVLNQGQQEFLYDPTSGIGSYAGTLSPPTISVMPPDVAKSSMAFSHSIQQLKSITTAEVSGLVDLFRNVETTEGLDSINELKKPISANNTISVASTPPLANGTNENGMFFLTDFVGSPTGIDTIPQMEAINKFFNEYDLSAYTQALSGGNVSALNTVINNMESDDLYKDASKAHTDIVSHITREEENLTSALIDLYLPLSSVAGVNGFTDGLHTYSERTDPKDMVDVLNSLVIANLHGESLTGAMIEGRNLKNLDLNGIKTDTRV